MKKQFFTLMAMVVIPFALSAKDISGTIANNTTLTALNSPYIVVDHINVDPGVTLTVESGVELRFNAGKYIQVFGTLDANSATFTANASTTPGFWPGIYVSYEYNANFGTVNLDNCVVEYAASIYVRKGTLSLENNCLVQNFSSYGIDLYTAGTLDISSTNIQNCTYPVYFRDLGGNGQWTVGSGVDLTGNATDYVFLNFRDVNSDLSLPDVGIPYYFDSELRVTSAASLNISAGAELLGNTNAYIAVNGKLKALGTAVDTIIFSNEPSNAHWRGINFNDGAVDTACLLTYCRFSGANYVWYNDRNTEILYSAVEINRSSPSFNNCEFSTNRYNLYVTGMASPTFTDCDFLESTYVAKLTMNISQDFNASPVFTNCSTAYNLSEGRAIGISGNTVYHDAHLMHQSFTGIDSITYMLYGQAVIIDTASLEIDPGIVIKSNHYDDYIYANTGPLTGIGTPGNQIIFTYKDDDDHGSPADTYNDGTTSIGNNVGGRIILNSNATSHIEYWKILYGGRSTTNYAAYAYNGNIIKNCEIRNSHRGILFSNDAQLVNNTLGNIVNYPLGRRMNDGAPVLLNNSIENSGHLGIFVHDFMAGTYSVGGFDLSGQTNAAYILDNNRDIPETADITILPGTVFKFNPYYGKLSVRGGLKAAGSKTNKVIFTSIYDNSASGNTNFNGGADPTGYKWVGIEFFGTSNDNLNELNNSEVRYVSQPIKMTNCKVVIDSILLNFSDNQALGIFGDANPVITNSAFNNLAKAPVHMDMFSNPTFSGNTIANVAQVGLSINGGTISGTVPARSFAGYDTITYLMYSPLRVDDVLTIPAGIVFKGSGNSYFDIYGRLNVLGMPGNPVIFTSLQDDSYGNPMDTQQNGPASITKNGNRVVFRDASDDNSMINHALFAHSYSYGVYFASASPTVKNTHFYRTNTTGLHLVGNSTPQIDSCNFEDLPYPITSTLMTFPGSEQGNMLTGTTARAIRIIDNETLTQDYTLTKKSFAGIANIPYVFDRYTIGTSAVLTIEPGVVLKFRQNGYINVRKGLIAVGGATPDSAIVFTSDRDDFYGGDTYVDGEASLPNNYWWRGVYFAQEAIDNDCVIDNCIFKNATRYYSSGANTNNRAAITMDNASPTIQNTLFEENRWAILARNTSLPLITNCDIVGTHPSIGFGVWNETGTVTLVAENCWWNDPSGPYNATSNPAGLGERVSDNVDFDPWITQTAKPIMGDISLNGEIMPYDASLVLQHTVGNITLDPKQLSVADVSGNDEVTSYDASLILQYSVGLITNFDEGPMKSDPVFEGISVTAPASFELKGESSFILPIFFSTPAWVKSLELKIESDPEHVRFTGLNSGDMPPEIMMAHGYSEKSGLIRISFASATDLKLNMHELGLVFELSGSASAGSGVALKSLLANETSIHDPLFVTELYGLDQSTRIGDPQMSGPLDLYSIDGQIIARLDLKQRQSRLQIAVYDMSGRMINTITRKDLQAGNYEFSIPAEMSRKASNEGPAIIAVTVRGDNFNVSRKLILK